MYDLISGITSGDISWNQLKLMGFDVVSGDLKYVYDNRGIPFGEKSYSNDEIYAYGEHLAGAYAEIMNIGSTVFGGVKSAKSIVGELKAMCNCFTAGTEVLTDEGEKNIEDIEVGDMVLAKDEVTGEQAYKEVVALHHNEKDTTYKLSVGNQIIETTDNHPFWVEGKGWILS